MGRLNTLGREEKTLADWVSFVCFCEKSVASNFWVGPMFYSWQFINPKGLTMKTLRIISLVIAATLAGTAFAAELQNAKMENSREQPHLVVVLSGKDKVADFKLTKSGTLNIEAEDLAYRMAPGGAKAYSLRGRCKLELLVEGKPVLSVSGDSILVQDLKEGLK